MSKTIFSSEELQHVVKYGKEIARQHERPLTSLHILIALMTKKPNYCLPILHKAGVKLDGEGSIQEAGKRLKTQLGSDRLDEPEDTLKVMHDKACQLAQNQGHDNINSLYFVLALCRLRKSLAFQVLTEAGINLARLRQALLSRVSTLPSSDHVRLAEDDASQEPFAAAGEPERSVSPSDSAPSVAQYVRPAVKAQAAAKTAAPSTESGDSITERDLGDAFGLDPDEFPLLTSIARNITQEAAEGLIDPVIGREKEIQQMIQILKKRRTNNPCLVGDPGVGKTALVEGLALEIANESPAAWWLKDKLILGLETASLVAGTQLRGSFSEKMIQLKDEVKRSGGRVIIFIDEIHTLVGAGAGDSALDAANELKTALARGEFPCIGATTPPEYDLYIKKDLALERRFKQVYVAEPNPEETKGIIRGVINLYEDCHEIKYSAASIEAAVRLAGRYVTDRSFPDKALELLDTAGARTAVRGGDEVLENDVAHVLSLDLGIPIERMLLHSNGRFKEMSGFFAEHVIGHERPVHRVCEAIKRGIAGFSSSRPLASFLFVGPQGVGKMSTAQALARFLFDREDSILHFQMSEFTEKHAIGKLIGTAPGYVGHEQGGRLTDAIRRRPFRIIYFKDVLSAHPDVQELIFQLLTTGTLTDGQGRKAFFANTVVVLSQHTESDSLLAGGSSKRVGFAPASSDEPQRRDSEEVLRELERKFPMGLYSGTDERLVFYPLSDDEALQIAAKEAAIASSLLKEERDISFDVTDQVLGHLVANGGYSASSGAAGMRQTLARTVVSFLAERLLEQEIGAGDHVKVDLEQGQLTCGPG